MSLVTTFQVGGIRCHALEAGFQRLDGGAMFGVVPRPLWSRRIAPDDRNRILLALRCLLVEHEEGLVLIDTGLGNKEDAKFRDIYGVDNDGKGGRTRLEDALAQAGFQPGDIRWVLNTHLHFDHAGGNTFLDDGHVALSFPNATCIVQRGELHFAMDTNERTRASYLPHNFEPVTTARKWRLLEGDGDVFPGIGVRLTPGHVPWHQCVLVHDRGETACFLADLAPTSAHLPLPWIMGYDLEPLRTLESKRALMAEAEREGWRLVFEHDAAAVSCRVARSGRDVEPVDVVAPPSAG